jgi:predicted amidophosphoribosyltransferase
MICPHCKKEIADDSKFCEFCGNGIKVSYKGVIDQILKEKDRAVLASTKRKKYFYFFKNTILILCVYVLSAYVISLSFDKYTPTEVSFIFAIPATVLIIFIYNKVAKKFNL